MKCILLLLDGLGDRSFEELKNMTPLQAAETPVLDMIAAGGSNGLFHAGECGQAFPSEMAHFIMFGYDLAEFPGRGPLEALGADIPLKDETAILAHFASVSADSNGYILKEQRPQIIKDDLDRLSRRIKRFTHNNIEISFHVTEGRDGVLLLGGDASPHVTDSDPIAAGRHVLKAVPCEGYKDDTAALRTAAALNCYLKWVYDELYSDQVNAARLKKKECPVNFLVTQRAGSLKSISPFEQRTGQRAALMASGIVYKGLSRYTGMDFIRVPDTEDPGADIAERIRLAERKLGDYDFIHVHTKMPDKAAHTKDPVYKKTVIESLDRGIGSVIDSIKNNPEILLIVASDHSTPSSGPLIHSGEPVPVIFHGRGVRVDNVKSYSEVDAACGALGFLRGRELYYMMLNYINMSVMEGLSGSGEALI